MSEDLKCRILIVEDHADSAVMLTRLLKRAGYDVYTAGKVAEALQVAQSAYEEARPFQLVVSDLGLPDGTGYDLMKKLRDSHHLPGIALSGYGQAEDVRRAMEAGFSHHLTKPIDFDRLKLAMQDLLNSQPAAA
ncbi:MAG TPA: response regulator [Chthoniobacterales bacterium]|jgi:CheY-like chemotaxis protein